MKQIVIVPVWRELGGGLQAGFAILAREVACARTLAYMRAASQRAEDGPGESREEVSLVSSPTQRACVTHTDLPSQ